MMNGFRYHAGTTPDACHVATWPTSCRCSVCLERDIQHHS